MKLILAIVCTLSLAVLSGCESLSNAADSIREKLAARDDPRVQDYAAPPRATYEAVRVTADQMGFRFLHGGPAQGQFEAISSVAEGDALNSARQVSMKVRLHDTSDGGTEVTVVLKEVIEADTTNHAGVATETPLRDTALYDTFLRSVQKALDAQAADKKG